MTEEDKASAREMDLIMGVCTVYQNDFTNHFDPIKRKYTLELINNQGIPELRVGPKGLTSYTGYLISFEDWVQFEEFVEELNIFHRCLEGIHK